MAIEPRLGQIKRIDERVDHTNRIALVDPVIEAFGQQSRLPAIRPRNEALHQLPPQNRQENHSSVGVFTQPGSKPSKTLSPLSNQGAHGHART